MNQVSLNKTADDMFSVQGDLTINTVHSLIQSGETAITHLNSPLKIDLAAVSQCDSACLALLIDWVRIANRCDKKINFVNAPEQLVKLAELSGLKDILNIRHGDNKLT